MLCSPIGKNVLGIVVMLCILIASGTAHATLDVNATISPLGGGLFHYSFTIGNTGTDDVAIVSIVDAPINDPFIDPTLIAPAGFLASYDPIGFVDFLEGTDLFAALTTVDGFAFDSASGPNGFFHSFEAFTVNGDLITGTVTSTVSAVPEPNSVMLMAAGLCAFFLRKAKKKCGS